MIRKKFENLKKREKVVMILFVEYGQPIEKKRKYIKFRCDNGNFIFMSKVGTIRIGPNKTKSKFFPLILSDTKIENLYENVITDGQYKKIINLFK